MTGRTRLPNGIPVSSLYGLSVSRLTFRQTVRLLVDRAVDGVPTNVAALNAGKVVAMEESAELRDAMKAADLVVPDGQSIVWSSRLLAHPLPERVTGIDLMEATISEAADRQLPVFFLGARQEVLEKALYRLKRSYPGLLIAGYQHGYFSQEQEEEVVRRIASSGARFLYIAMTTPKKEIFVANHMAGLGVPVVQGVGGSLDVWAGATRRAPEAMQRVGLEWFYRFAQEPRRMWRRYLLGNAEFAALTMRELYRSPRPSLKRPRVPAKRRRMARAQHQGARRGDGGSPERILMVGPTPPPYNGMSVATSQMMDALGDRFPLIHLDSADRRDLSNVGKLDFQNVFLGLKHAATFSYLLVKESPSLIHLPIAQSTLPFIRDSLFLLPARWLSTPVVVHLHGGAFDRFYRDSSNAMRILIRYSLGRVSRVVVLGRRLAHMFEGIVPAERIRVIPNGTKDLISPLSESVDRSSQAPVVLFLSSLIEEKGVFDVIEAIPLVLDRTEATFVFAGGWRNSEVRERAKSLMDELGIRDATRFVGTVGPAQKEELLSSATVMALPSRNEGQPFVILEAMRPGMPIVSTDVGSIPEVVVDGETGFVVPTDAPEVLADKLIAVLSDPVLRGRLSAAARQRYLSNYTLERWAKDMERLFREVLAQPWTLSS